MRVCNPLILFLIKTHDIDSDHFIGGTHHECKEYQGLGHVRQHDPVCQTRQFDTMDSKLQSAYAHPSLVRLQNLVFPATQEQPVICQPYLADSVESHRFPAAESAFISQASIQFHQPSHTQKTNRSLHRQTFRIKQAGVTFQL